MHNLFKDAFKITNYNIILTVPLIIFVKILDLYSIYSKASVDSVLKFFIASITVLFMFGVFCSGWFYMIKGAIKLSKKVFVLDEDRAKATLNLFKIFPEGVGNYFLSFVGVYVLFFFIQAFATPIVYFIGVNIIGSLDSASMLQLQDMVADPSFTANQSMAGFIEALTPEQIIFFGKWSLLFMLMTLLLIYLLMLWIPEVMYESKNPFIALGKSIVKLFKGFFETFRIFVTIWIIGFLLLFAMTFAVMNPIAYILMSIILFYFSVYFVIVIFLYYDKKYEKADDQD